MLIQRYRNRTISEADADQLHLGMRAFARLHKWKVVAEVDPDDPTRITLADLAIGSGMDSVQADTIDDDDDDDEPQRLLHLRDGDGDGDGEIIPYAGCSREQCERDDDCALVRGHRGDCYLTASLTDADFREQLRAARQR